MYLNKQLYDALPAIYILTGYGAAQLPDTWMSFIGGSLATLAGIMVYHMRRNKNDL